jgi:hypothetical protein
MHESTMPSGALARLASGAAVLCKVAVAALGDSQLRLNHPACADQTENDHHR